MTFQELYRVLNAQLNDEALRLATRASEATLPPQPLLGHSADQSESIIQLFLTQLQLHRVAVDATIVNETLAASRTYFAQSYQYHLAQLTQNRQVSDAATQADTIEITAEFARALDLLHNGKSMFLTGKAGTGKSTLIRHFLSATSGNVITVAPTGIAALNVDGYTIHRLFSFRPGTTVDDVRNGTYFPGRFAQVLSKLDTLVIDEVSMVRADLFDMLAAALERFGPQPGTPFGGVQLVLVGDLYQLPPVVPEREQTYISETYGTAYFFSATSYDRTRFPTLELTKVFRQIGDARLVDLLNAVRSGELLDEARTELNQRTDADFHPTSGEFWLTLATTNRIVGARNRHMLEQLTDSPKVFTASVSGDTDGFEFPTDEQLHLAVDAQVMLLNNDQAGRWVNGSIGKITRIDESGIEPVITVRLRDGRDVHVGPHTWDITRPHVQAGALRHEVIGAFTQLPMKLAWAITIHKSQGQTLDRVVVDLTGGTFANGQLYVALSRCTSLEGLVLKRDVLPRDLKTDILVRRFLESGATSPQSMGRVFISMLKVGREGDRYRPRPIEIALVTEDGDEATTMINPTSDLFSAQQEFGITARDVALAPVLPEAWAALTPLLNGRIPIGVDIDDTLGIIDFELKRNGTVVRMPLGVELPQTACTNAERRLLQAPDAMTRARALRDIVYRLDAQPQRHPLLNGGTTFDHHSTGHGYLLQRATGPHRPVDPESFIVGGTLSVEDDSAQVLAGHLAEAWARVVDRDITIVELLRRVEQHFGVQVLPEDFELASKTSVESVLVAGSRVCFTGEVVSPQYGAFSRSEMTQLAVERGLTISPNMTKTKTDVLVVAERGSQSGKAKKAAEWDKPVLAAEDFLEWAFKHQR